MKIKKMPKQKRKIKTALFYNVIFWHVTPAQEAFRYYTLPKDDLEKVVIGYPHSSRLISS